MKISYKWVLDYLPINIEPQEMENILTDVGLEVEHTESLRDQIPYLENVVVGKVLELSPHPDADRLRIAIVDVAEDEPLHIICGAPNIAQGIKVPVAKIGAQLRSLSGATLKIKKAKIRGVESYGMICSQEELGVGPASEGIWVLPEDATLGQAISEFLDLPNADTIYTIGLTPNRTDAMSHIGVASNIAAYLSFHRQAEIAAQQPALKFPTSLQEPSPFSVELEDAQDCPRYMGLRLTEVRVGESPLWIQEKLRSLGVKSINNVVDITNFVLKECGQPLHAFDRDKISGDKIIVRKATEGEKITTLDGEEQKLKPEDILICDKTKPLCIAGVYGGLGTGVTEETQEVFLESAYFDPTTIRRTSMRLGLRTDAAVRYEKGVDISMLRYALYRAALLLVEYADAVILGPVIDQYPSTMQQHEIEFSVERVNKIIGKNYQAKDLERLLKGLNFEIQESKATQLRVAVPFALHDVSGVADIAEEVLRIDGLNNIPMDTNMSIVPPSLSDYTKTQLLRDAQMYLSKAGFQEILTNSIVDSAYFGERKGLIHMINNLSANLDCMRPVMLHSGLEAIAYNLNRQQSRIRFFEIGKTYYQKSTGDYLETEYLSIWVAGYKNAPHWQTKQRSEDLYGLRAIVADFMAMLGISPLRITEALEQEYYLEQYSLSYGDQEAATIARVHPDLLQKFDIKTPVWYAQIPIDLLTQHLKTEVQYEPMSKFPAVQRDLALMVDRDLHYGLIEQEIQKLGIDTLKNIELFDLYEGDKIPQSKKSLAVSFWFESAVQTLTVEEVDASIKKVVTCLQQKFGAELRS